MSKENDNKENQTISREQVYKWALSAGFMTTQVRGDIAKFETFAETVRYYIEDTNNVRNNRD